MASCPMSPLDKRMQCLVAGFDALQDEYQRLWTRCQTLESSLETAKSQYFNSAGESLPKVELITPQQSSIDTKSSQAGNATVFSTIADATRRNKITAACRLSQQLRALGHNSSNGVAIHSGPSADRSSAPTSAMEPISESPLEQDFTVEGVPSKLGCPFASMANRKLSSHAAEVVSRYRPMGSGVETPLSSVSRINGRASSVAKASFNDPIKAETCGMESLGKTQDVEASVQGSTGICPIRLLDQHSPEEVAAYFESHKHELPRSHEVCVKRYQGNEQSVRQLDAKYGNLASMISDLGHKHTALLPEKHGDEDELNSSHHASDEKIRKWASSVDTDAKDVPPVVQVEPDEEDDRQPRFDRSLKDVRLGESPSRPWGIQVPIHVNRRDSYASSAAAPAPVPSPVDGEKAIEQEIKAEKPRGKCPFDFGAAGGKPDTRPQTIPAPAPAPEAKEAGTSEAETRHAPEVKTVPGPTFINPQSDNVKPGEGAKTAPQMVFTGPVFIGFSLEQAMGLLQSSQQNGGIGAQG